MEETKTINANELFDKYDEIINITMINLYTLSKEKREIVLSDINRKDRNHLFILRVALIAKDVYNFPLKIQTSFWNWLCLNWRMRKISHRVPRVKEYDNPINVNRLIGFMQNPIKKYMGVDFEFANIYNQFYKGDLN